MVKLRRLGNSELYLSPLGLGAWQFSGGNGFGSRFWKKLSISTVQDIIRTSIKGGVNWIDTAEAYGNGASEQAIDTALSCIAEKEPTLSAPYLADKWWPLGRKASSLAKTIGVRRGFLGGRVIDLYQIHHPTSVSTLQKQIYMMKKLVTNGDIRYVGVSNFNAAQMCKTHTLLQQEGLQLVSNQVRYNLFDRSIEHNGILDAAKQLGISIIAYSPLHQGLLTGKYHQDPTQLQRLFWLRKAQYSLNEKTLQKTAPLIEQLQQLAQKYECSPAQVALNWLIHANSETVFAIPGASSSRHAQSNIGAMDFRLSTEEIQALSRCQ